MAAGLSPWREEAFVSEHISKAFEAELTQLGGLIDSIGSLALRQIEAVLDAAEGKNHAGLALVIAREPEADRLEHVIDRLVIHILALRQPMAIDLRQVLSSFKVAIELERVCDHAKDMAERFEAAAGIGSANLGAMVALGRRGALMLRDAISAYRKSDAALAKDVRQRDRALDEDYTALFRDVLASMSEDVRCVSAGTQLLFMARDIERIGDLATDVAEMASYLVLGEPVEDDRPKADRTKSIVLPASG
jgi:phosphate transport system protein